MGRYIEWDDVIDRYPEINTLGGADELSSTYIVYAESFVDGLLKSRFTIPFSSNNMVVKDLCIDCVFWRAGRFKLDNAAEVREQFFETVNLLRSGDLAMVDVSGNALGGDINPGVFSTTQSYSSSFGMDDPENWQIDEDIKDYYADDRD